MGIFATKNGSTQKVVTALCDYQGDPNRLNFKQNDQLTILDDKSSTSWWYAKSHRTNKKGWIPYNYVAPVHSISGEPWYYGKMTRAKSEKLLRRPGNESGAFLIRESDRCPGKFALSLLDNDRVNQYLIHKSDRNDYFLNENAVFRTLQELVQHHSLISDGLCCPLGQPCVKGKAKPQTSGLDKDVWEIPHTELTVIKKLGEGQFGEVYMGYWKRIKPVAIKKLKTDSTISDKHLKNFLLEAQIMKELVHKHIVQLYGVCTTHQPIYIVSELMQSKSLLEYLESDLGKTLDLINLIDIGAQIAEGMAYLEQTNCIHRDLAARNVLLDEKNTAKIADFGLARAIPNDIYIATGGASFPIRWTAPEALFYSKFSIKSDVWSFGILLTELVTYGATPYSGLKNVEVAQRLESNYRMARPQNCPEILYDIMLLCWQRNPKDRPTFVNLQYRLEEILTNGAEYQVVHS